MSLKYSLLGFLSYAPASGYELTKMFFKPIRPIRSEVYRYLKIMLEEGLVKADRIEQEKLPAKNVFHITKAGRRMLNKWLTTFTHNKMSDDQLSYILWYSSLVDKKDTIKLLQQYREAILKDYQYYQTIGKRYVKSGSTFKLDDNDGLYKNLVYSFVLSRYQNALEFIEKVINAISYRDKAEVKRRVSYKKVSLGKDA